jgi:hypothetical protein
VLIIPESLKTISVLGRNLMLPDKEADDSSLEVDLRTDWCKSNAPDLQILYYIILYYIILYYILNCNLVDTWWQ